MNPFPHPPLKMIKIWKLRPLQQNIKLQNSTEPFRWLDAAPTFLVKGGAKKFNSEA